MQTLSKIETANKKEKYEVLIPQLRGLFEGEQDRIANMANLCAALKETFNFFWVGFYIVQNDQLVLGPFQGSIACTRIPFGKGICGRAWKERKSLIIDDVTLDSGHIACSAESKSEIVIPIRNKAGEIAAVLDIDEKTIGAFDHMDQVYLEIIAGLISPCL